MEFRVFESSKKIKSSDFSELFISPIWFFKDCGVKLPSESRLLLNFFIGKLCEVLPKL